MLYRVAEPCAARSTDYHVSTGDTYSPGLMKKLYTEAEPGQKAFFDVLAVDSINITHVSWHGMWWCIMMYEYN